MEGVFRSTDGGATWAALNRGMSSAWDTELALSAALALSPAFETDDTLFAATMRDGVFRSTDGGDSWEQVNRGISYPKAIHLHVEAFLALALGLGFAMLLAGRVVDSGNTIRLRTVAAVWRRLWIVPGLGVGIFIFLCGLTFWKLGLFSLEVLVSALLGGALLFAIFAVISGSYLAGTLLNFVPGFGLGYLVVRRQKAFGITLGLATVVAVIATGYALIGWELCTGDLLGCVIMYPLIGGVFAVIATVMINITTGVHLLVVGVRRRHPQ